MNDKAVNQKDIDRRIDEALRRRAQGRGPRGAEQAWSELMAQVESASPRDRRPRWALPSAVAAVAVIIAGASVGAQVLGGGSAEDDLPAAQRSTQQSTSTSPTPAPTSASPAPEAMTPEERSATYIACVRERGIDLDYAEMRRTRRPPDWVKTSREVPAEIHRPCFQAIGGRDPLASAFGVPTSLGECESIDRTPPIDWQPAPPQTFRGSAINTQGASVPQGTSWLAVTLREGVRDVPKDLVVECWNGQAWQPAYVVTGLGEDGGAAYAELEEGVELSPTTVEVAGRTLDIPVPGVAPTTDYRITETARSCANDGSCTTVPFDVSYSVTTP